MKRMDKERRDSGDQNSEEEQNKQLSLNSSNIIGMIPVKDYVANIARGTFQQENSLVRPDLSCDNDQGTSLLKGVA